MYQTLFNFTDKMYARFLAFMFRRIEAKLSGLDETHRKASEKLDDTRRALKRAEEQAEEFFLKTSADVGEEMRECTALSNVIQNRLDDLS